MNEHIIPLARMNIFFSSKEFYMRIKGLFLCLALLLLIAGLTACGGGQGGERGKRPPEQGEAYF
jgi:hypothetical protein